MRAKEKNILLIVILAALLFMVFDCFTGKAGSLEPNEPPGSTMVTLSQLSAKIEALSSPIKKVVRGVITFENYETIDLQDLSSSVDPNHSVVMLNDAVASNHDGTIDDWISRTGACLIDLTETQITVRVELLPMEQKVSYQVIEYK